MDARDAAIHDVIFGDADLEEYSAAQITDILAAYFICYADSEALLQLGWPYDDDGLRLAA